MAQQAIPGGAMLPSGPLSLQSIAFMSNTLMDASTEKVCWVVPVPDTGTLDKIEFRVGTVAINASSVVRVSFQTVSDTNGEPDGTQSQYRDIAGSAFASNTWMIPGLMTSDGTDGGAKRSVTRGDLVAVVFEYQTFTAADSLIVNGWTLAGGTTLRGLVYGLLYTGSWAKLSTVTPLLALKYNDGTYRPISEAVPPWKAVTGTAFNSSSTPDERGMKFSVPVPCVLRGAFANLSLTGATNGGCTFKLYDSDGSTVLQSVTLDPDQKQGTSSRLYTVSFPDTTLAANTFYRITVLPTSTTSLNFWDADVETAGHLNAVEGGADFHSTERTDAGAWTDTTTKRPFMGLWISGFDDAVSSGGIAARLVGGSLV